MSANTWFEAIHLCQQHSVSYVLVTLISSAGSTPRNSGTKMVITADSIYDTIGGGHLEHQVIKKAKLLLAENQQTQYVEHYPLSSKLGQCCGGATNVLFEVLVDHTQTLAVFGAGHVAKALIPIASKLPLKIKWFDPRPEMFADLAVSQNVEPIVMDDSDEAIGNLGLNPWVLILTHNHQLDFDIVCASLKRTDINFIGMIGSDTKAKRFKTRLAHREYNQSQVDRLISPVGDLSVPGKHPIEVAVSISAQLIQLLHAETPEVNQQQRKQEWLKTKTLIGTL